MANAAMKARQRGPFAIKVDAEEKLLTHVSSAAPERLRVDGKYFAQGNARVRVQGVTYGPFAPNAQYQPFPSVAQARIDFELMRAASINAIRTYHQPPPEWLEAAADYQHWVMVDVPWSKHVCFLDSRKAQADAREAVRRAVASGLEFPQIFAYSIGNEIPANIVRWHGAARVERFLRELVDVAKQTAPETLVTYTNYPSTEYLDQSYADFVTFNVYLHDRDVFRRYLHRLQNLVGDKPLLLGELGMDSMRNGEPEQADFLDQNLREVVLRGLAGAFVFAWTDDWHTGGHAITDWAFGITDRARIVKPAYHAVREVFESAPTLLLSSSPKTSVVVCTYNGGTTLEQCLHSLLNLNYPDYEVIVIDDGSTDRTSEILERFPSVRAVRQDNRGLSAARNVGLHEAQGSIIAYTDSDCFVDADWLTLLVDQLQTTGAAAVGGPNLTPDDGWLATCVAASPGQPTHVLENDQVAEHIPGCNMAFCREALLAVSGFDYQFRKAGDDVDICWRLQQEGYWITFAPGAFVWHHRRQSPRAYLRQQAGYGEAEALLRFKHPDRFTGLGDGKWNGVLYGAARQGICLDRPIVYRGTFGTGMFQCLYQPRPAHWAMLPSTLEWHLVLLVWAFAIPGWPALAWLVLAMWGLSLGVAALRGFQANLPRRHDGLRSRLLVMALCYVQPLVRAWHRQRTRLFSYHRPLGDLPRGRTVPARLPFFRALNIDYWIAQDGLERVHLLGLLIANLNEKGWATEVDTGWESWDLEVFCRPWTQLRIATAQEEHGSGKRLIRVRCQAHPSGYTRTIWVLALVIAVVGIVHLSWPYVAIAGGVVALGALAYGRGVRRARSVLMLIDAIAEDLGIHRCGRRSDAATTAMEDSSGATNDSHGAEG